MWTRVYLMTDERSHHLECKQVKHNDVTGLAIEWRDGVFTTVLDKGVTYRPRRWYQFIMHRVPVVLRIDDGSPIRQKWQWNSDIMCALTTDSKLANILLTELPKGRRIVLQIQDTPGQIFLYGSLAAVKDFRSRIESATVK